MMYSACKWNKKGDDIQPWHTPLPNSEPVHCSKSGSNCCFLTCIQISQEAGKVIWHSHLFKNFPQFFVIHTGKGFSVVNKPKVDVFLEFSWFFYDPMDVGNLISGCSAFSKSSLNIWKFMVHVLLKPCLKNFEHYFVRTWNKCNCAVVWTLFGIAFLWDWNETGLFWSCGHCWVFQICWHTKCSILTASYFRTWNNSARISSPPPTLFRVMHSKAHLTSHSWISGSRWVITSWFSGSLRSFLPGEISITSDMQMTPPLWQKVKRN